MSTIVLLWKNVKWRFKNKITIIVTIVQPLIWLILYSSIANSSIDNYTGFMLPGIMILVMCSACSSSGMLNYSMKSQGSFYRLLIAPVHRSSIVLGQNLEAIFLSLLEIGILLIIGFIMSAKFHFTLVGILIVLLLLILTAFFISNLAYSISLKLPNEMIYETVMNIIVLPLFFGSTALFPLEKVHGFMRKVILINPLSHVINAIRDILLYQEQNNSYICLIIIGMACLGIISFMVSIHTLRRETN